MITFFSNLGEGKEFKQNSLMATAAERDVQQIFNCKKLLSKTAQNRQINTHIRLPKKCYVVLLVRGSHLNWRSYTEFWSKTTFNSFDDVIITTETCIFGHGRSSSKTKKFTEKNPRLSALET